MKHLKHFRVLCICVVVMLATLAFFSCDHFSKATNPAVQTDTLSSVQEEGMTIKEWLDWRESIREDAFNDSVFLVIPEQALTFILVQCGTDLTVSDIVHEYVAHKEFYDVTVVNAMKTHDKVKQPDSIPSLPKIDKPITTINNDTLNPGN